MEKKALVSLLAIPVFSLAVATTSCKFLTRPVRLMKEQSLDVSQEPQKSESIKTETVAAGVIDFLLGNPKTANKMNPTEQLAMGIIGNLFKTQGQRKHEIDYATAGRSQFTINTNDGRQAQFVKDEGGNIYIVMDGVIHPVSQEFINQARGAPATLTPSYTRNAPIIENATLLPYNLGGLESMFNSSPKEEIRYDYHVQKGGEYLSDIAKKLDVPKSNIFYWADIGGPIWDVRSKIRPIKNQKKIWEDRKKIKRSLPFSSRTALVIVKEKHKNEISAVFSYKWHKDLNYDGALDFNEFNQIKRTFYDGEDLNIGVKYQTEKGFKGNLEIKILEDNTGKLLVNEKIEILSNGPMVGQQYIPAESLPGGAYLLYTNLINDNLDSVSSKSERFEIVQNPSEIKK